MRARKALAPLASGRTLRRAVFLLLGGVVALPYMALGLGLRYVLTLPSPGRAGNVLILVVTAGIVTVPLFLAGTRTLQITAARALLEVALPDPGPAGVDAGARSRAALWAVLHMAAGGVFGAALVTALPLGLALLAEPLDLARDSFTGLRWGPLDENDTVQLTVLGGLILVALVYLVAGAGAAAAALAPVLLGPSRAERIAALESHARHLAERNRLARELHDSVGHALTVAVLQSGAAREVADTDPEFTQRALRAIEETGRRALEDLDHVLGLLRAPDDAHDDRSPQHTLADLHQLLADTRAAGRTVVDTVDGDLDGLPAAVSREGYRIVQEGLTNAIRHGSDATVRLRIEVCADSLGIDLVNGLTTGPGRGVLRPGRTRHPRGLSGLRERVLLLGGDLTVGPHGDEWRVAVRLPTRVPA